MARWIQELGTYEFDIIHQPRKKHGSADGLSQGPCCQCGREEQEGRKSSAPGSVIATILWTQED